MSVLCAKLKSADYLKWIIFQGDVKMIACNNCKAELKDGAKFCSKCGEKVNMTVFCSECGVKMEQGEMFCSECGTKANTTPETTAKLAEKASAGPQPVNDLAVGQVVFVRHVDEEENLGEYYCHVIVTVKDDMAYVGTYFLELEEKTLDEETLNKHHREWVSLSDIVTSTYALNNMKLKHWRVYGKDEDGEDITSYQSCEVISAEGELLKIRYADGATAEVKLSDITACGEPKQISTPTQQHAYTVGQKVLVPRKGGKCDYGTIEEIKDENAYINFYYGKAGWERLSDLQEDTTVSNMKKKSGLGIDDMGESLIQGAGMIKQTLLKGAKVTAINVLENGVVGQGTATGKFGEVTFSIFHNEIHNVYYDSKKSTISISAHGKQYTVQVGNAERVYEVLEKQRKTVRA